jgi:hypothetical protein
MLSDTPNLLVGATPPQSSKMINILCVLGRLEEGELGRRGESSVSSNLDLQTAVLLLDNAWVLAGWEGTRIDGGWT